WRTIDAYAGPAAPPAAAGRAWRQATSQPAPSSSAARNQGAPGTSAGASWPTNSANTWLNDGYRAYTQQGDWILADPRDPGRSDRTYPGAGGRYRLVDPGL